ncbi:MAG: hypothetical protein K2Z80_27675 [Xanthobacteraceae bacterium]|nr:hypothetical protein [Xanthobacteraceae bacterium]
METTTLQKRVVHENALVSAARIRSGMTKIVSECCSGNSCRQYAQLWRRSYHHVQNKDINRHQAAFTGNAVIIASGVPKAIPPSREHFGL